MGRAPALAAVKPGLVTTDPLVVEMLVHGGGDASLLSDDVVFRHGSRVVFD